MPKSTYKIYIAAEPACPPLLDGAAERRGRMGPRWSEGYMRRLSTEISKQSRRSPSPPPSARPGALR